MTDGWNMGWNAVAAKPVNNNHTISLSPPLIFTQFYIQQSLSSNSNTWE